MKLNSHTIAAGVAGGLAVVACAEGVTLFDGGWRVSVGGVYNSPVKADLKFAPRSVPWNSPWNGRKASDARQAAEGVTSGTMTRYGDTGSWIDRSDGQPGADSTWNAYIANAKGSIADESELQENVSFLLSSLEYSEVIETTYDVNADRHYDDESAMPGISVDLSRCVYHNPEWKFGIDVCVGFMYFFNTDVYKVNTTYGSVTRDSGRYNTTIEGDYDPWTGLNADGSYGIGSALGPTHDSFAGPGPVFNLGTLHTWKDGKSFTQNSTLHAHGDYDELELIFSVRPYYDVTDWFRLYGTLGVVVSRADFHLDVAMSQGGETIRYSHNYDEWDVYGIAGLGAMLRYKDFTLGFDFLARFLDDDISVDDPYVHGDVERGDWLFRVAVGYEF